MSRRYEEVTDNPRHELDEAKTILKLLGYRGRAFILRPAMQVFL